MTVFSIYYLNGDNHRGVVVGNDDTTKEEAVRAFCDANPNERAENLFAIQESPVFIDR